MRWIVMVALLAGCFPVANPRGVVVRQNQEGGSIALYNEDDVEPSQHLAQRDAERQMAAHCAPRRFRVVGIDRHDTGNSVVVSQGWGVSTSRQVTVKRLDYICESSPAP